MNRMQALHSFWSSFGWKAYDASSVPDDAIRTDGHYITYDVADADFGSTVALSANLWMRSTLWDVISDKAMEIYDRLKSGGITIPADDGYLWIKRGNPFSTRVNDENDDIRRIYINIEVDFMNV